MHAFSSRSIFSPYENACNPSGNASDHISNVSDSSINSGLPILASCVSSSSDDLTSATCPSLGSHDQFTIKRNVFKTNFDNFSDNIDSVLHDLTELSVQFKHAAGCLENLINSGKQEKFKRLRNTSTLDKQTSTSAEYTSGEIPETSDATPIADSGSFSGNNDSTSPFFNRGISDNSHVYGNSSTYKNSFHSNPGIADSSVSEHTASTVFSEATREVNKTKLTEVFERQNSPISPDNLLRTLSSEFSFETWSMFKQIKDDLFCSSIKNMNSDTINSFLSDFNSVRHLFVIFFLFFPGQIAFCKKAVVGLAARRIF